MSENDKCTAFVIGDPHLKHTEIQRGCMFIDRVVSEVKSADPTFIVVLGDVFDNFESVNTHAIKMVHNLLQLLSGIAPTVVLVGNHDYINNSQFLTNNHSLLPFSEWENIWVVDRPTEITFSEKSFVFCPYVPPGKFVAALDTLTGKGVTWEFADCIFAHQEFQGCHMGKITSTDGDEWDDDYPPVISGHIHDDQKVGENIYYPGSAIQHSYAENSYRRVWLVDFNVGTDEDVYFNITKIDLKLPPKIVYRMCVEELLDKKGDKDFIQEISEGIVKIELKDTDEEFKKFKRTKFSKNLSGYNVKFTYVRVEDKHDSLSELCDGNDDVTFTSVFRQLVMTKEEKIQEEYKNIFSSPVINFIE